MDLLFKVVKFSLLGMLVFVLAVVFAPTPHGAFLVIHFSTTLQASLLVYVLFVALSLMARTSQGFLPLQAPLRLRSSLRHNESPIQRIHILRC